MWSAWSPWRLRPSDGPPEGADLIDDVRRVSSTVSQIAAMENEVRCDLPQVGENCLEGAPIAVNIRYDCDSHFVRCRLCDNGLDTARYNSSLSIETVPEQKGTKARR